MKKTLAILGALLALAACNKQPLAPVSDQGIKVNLTINRSDDFPGTKATVKEGWADNDVVFVFFRGIADDKYMELKYNSGSWTATPKNGLEGSDLADASSKLMSAVYLPYGSDLSPSVDAEGKFVFDEEYLGWTLYAQQKAYTYDDTEGLQGTLDMEMPIPIAGPIYHFDITGYESGHEYELYTDDFAQIRIVGVESATVGVTFGERYMGEPLKGYEDSANGIISFSGALNAVGYEPDFQFSVLDKTANILYTRDTGIHPLTKETYWTSKAVGLGDISDPDKWNAMEFVYLGIDNQYGKKICWATKNLGATAVSGEGSYGLYYAFGDIVGHPIVSGNFSDGFTLDYAFDTAPEYELNGNGNLKPEYDAAHMTLKGLWRMPTIEELTALTEHVAYEPFETKSFDYGLTLTSTVEGYTDRTLFLPAAGEPTENLIGNAGQVGVYQSSTEKTVTSLETGDEFVSRATMWFVSIPVVDMINLSADGSTTPEIGNVIRPVFTID